uniref:P2X purinoceptor 1-like n=1 Tax=Gouania willdenowi TaxID=441366 RepID=A0A8C5DJP2_GOUWI
MKSKITSALADFFFEYETPRQVLVRNRRVGVVCRLIQLGVLGYIIGWVFIYEKGYQSTDTAVSSVFTKMKGVGYTNVSGTERVWDVADYVFPPQVSLCAVIDILQYGCTGGRPAPTPCLVFIKQHELSYGVGGRRAGRPLSLRHRAVRRKSVSRL